MAASYTEECIIYEDTGAAGFQLPRICRCVRAQGEQEADSLEGTGATEPDDIQIATSSRRTRVSSRRSGASGSRSTAGETTLCGAAAQIKPAPGSTTDYSSKAKSSKRRGRNSDGSAASAPEDGETPYVEPELPVEIAMRRANRLPSKAEIEEMVEPMQYLIKQLLESSPPEVTCQQNAGGDPDVNLRHLMQMRDVDVTLNLMFAVCYGDNGETRAVNVSSTKTLKINSSNYFCKNAGAAHSPDDAEPTLKAFQNLRF